MLVNFLGLMAKINKVNVTVAKESDYLLVPLTMNSRLEFWNYANTPWTQDWGSEIMQTHHDHQTMNFFVQKNIDLQICRLKWITCPEIK